ncbi:hypothetical protein QF000_007303 [Paraburkholderia atlantica]|uniref:hypothetical protein n=1 Tax=Paraburkholderia atlantica TaxID=2654982 RepID=UPI0012FB22B5|nr:hypothetical protein [Paraburkholderia atlantica]
MTLQVWRLFIVLARAHGEPDNPVCNRMYLRGMDKAKFDSLLFSAIDAPNLRSISMHRLPSNAVFFITPSRVCPHA